MLFLNPPQNSHPAVTRRITSMRQFFPQAKLKMLFFFLLLPSYLSPHRFVSELGAEQIAPDSIRAPKRRKPAVEKWMRGGEKGEDQRSKAVEKKEGGAASRHQKLSCAIIQLCPPDNKSLLHVGLQHNVRRGGERRGKHKIAKRAPCILFTFVLVGLFMNREQGTKGAVWMKALSLTSPALWTTCQCRHWSNCILSHLCTNPLKGLADLPISLYWGSNGKRHSLCLREFIKFIGLTCYF